ncbi:hypothetical protein CPC08DRAFT_769029 [Agrocybe pediades]|nr:hypothetical protein CPC08DRAFT_769029 [Agrocybe pediades]
MTLPSPVDFLCPYPGCNRTFRRRENLSQHYNAQHREISPDPEPDPQLDFTTLYHPKLNALPCDAKGNFISVHSAPQAPSAPDATSHNPWNPFNTRLDFDWAHYYFVELQASEKQINRGLDLWLASKIQSGNTKSSTVPWSSADEMYATIDSIQAGNAPFKTVSFRYAGKLPQNPPSWMTQTYELCTRDVRQVLHNQLSTIAFKDQINMLPYRQFDHQRDRVWSNFMSGDWAWKEADTIAEDPQTHGAMLVPIIAGSDKTTVSVATGHQEYHPVYVSPGNLTNTARRGHSNSVLPVAFLPIPKASRRQARKPAFQQFVRQVYHMCLAYIFSPLRAGMTTPDLVVCPDGHYRKAVYSLAAYIADYPEQVWLAGIVQGWCPKCDAKPGNLDDKSAHRRTHERSDFIINSFDPGTVWTHHGIRADIVPFTHTFPRADIHTMLSPDLLHQLIKGTFKDHLVDWINQYIYATHTEARALEIIEDIDRRISAVPSYSGLRRFSEGRNFEQWTGDDSKALMKVYIAAIAGYVPSTMVQCLSTFMELCYIFRRNAIASRVLKEAEQLLDQYHKLREVFVHSGIRTSISLPRQHALLHYITSIPLFGSPNGLCSSITESKHIKAVKEPWRRSNRFNALSQMLRMIVRLEKLQALRTELVEKGILTGSTAGYYAKLGNLSNLGSGSDTRTGTGCFREEEEVFSHENDIIGQDKCNDNADGTRGLATSSAEHDDYERLPDIGPLDGPKAMSSIVLAAHVERGYPKYLEPLSRYINEPGFPLAFYEFLYKHRHPTRPLPEDLESSVGFTGKINVVHSAVARFYAPSDLCGAGGMYRQRIRCNPSWYGYPRHDTVFVVEGDASQGMKGLLVARVRLLFSFFDDYTRKTVPCALVSWYVPAQRRKDPETQMWVVKPEGKPNQRPVQVIHLKSIARGAHLLPRYGVGRLPDYISYVNSLDEFQTYFVNPYIDHHCHEFLSN